MKATATIVEATSVHQIELVRALFQSYQSELIPQYRFSDTEWQTLPGAYGPPGGTLLLATVADEAAGCVGLRSFPLMGTCEMKRLYVAAGFRGHTIGVALIGRAIQEARALSYRRMRLDTHVATMGAAIKLYRRFGFVEVTSEPIPQVDGLMYMELRL